MIVRIMGEGQFRLDDAAVEQLNALDARLDHDLSAGDASEFAAHLEAMHALVRGLGTPLADDELAPSDAILPPADVSLEELRAMLGEEGLVPG